MTILLALIWLLLLCFVCNDAEDGFPMAVITIFMAILIFFTSIGDLIGVIITGLFLIGIIILFIWIKN